jgi:DNA-binding IscR family transcriptional regulator
MSANTHFTVALHIVTWMALASQQVEIVTSDQIAESVNTNPVFIRRILGRLHKPIWSTCSMERVLGGH